MPVDFQAATSTPTHTLQNASTSFQPPIMPSHGGNNTPTSSNNNENNNNINNKNNNANDNPIVRLSKKHDGASSPPGVQDAQRRPQRLVKKYRIEVAASMSSVLSTATAFPLDSVKTRMQTYRYSGFLDCVRRTYQTEHMRGFFRGRWPFLLLSFILLSNLCFCLP